MSCTLYNLYTTPCSPSNSIGKDGVHRPGGVNHTSQTKMCLYRNLGKKSSLFSVPSNKQLAKLQAPPKKTKQILKYWVNPVWFPTQIEPLCLKKNMEVSHFET